MIIRISIYKFWQTFKKFTTCWLNWLFLVKLFYVKQSDNPLKVLCWIIDNTARSPSKSIASLSTWVYISDVGCGIWRRRTFVAMAATERSEGWFSSPLSSTISQCYPRREVQSSSSQKATTANKSFHGLCCDIVLSQQYWFKGYCRVGTCPQLRLPYKTCNSNCEFHFQEDLKKFGSNNFWRKFMLW